jgi:hypothetical protein
VTITDFFRLPRINDSVSIDWVYSLGLCKFLKTLETDNFTLPHILTILLQRLEHMPPVAYRTSTDQQVIYACQAFAASTILSQSNLRSLRISILQPLTLYHPSANICFTSLMQMSLLLISEPTKQPMEHPLHLFQGFDQHKYPDAEWHLSATDFRAGKHPLQLFLKRKHLLSLIGCIREQEGAKDFKRTNNGLLKRTSAIKMGEALARAGISQINVMLILHRVLCEMVAKKDFYTADPQSADYQKLHDAYQVALLNKQQLVCDLAQTKQRLEQLGTCIRNYDNSRMRSLNEVIRENGSELLDRLTDDHYGDPLSNFIDREHQQQSLQLKSYVHQQLDQLATTQRESLLLSALGYNDSQIAKHQQVSASTIKRRRSRIIQKIFNVSVADNHFSAIDDAYLLVIQDYFVPAITVIGHELIWRFSCTTAATAEIITAINQRWQLNLSSNDRLHQSLWQLFQQEGVA